MDLTPSKREVYGFRQGCWGRFSQMKIPVFVSAPTQLSRTQQNVYNGIVELLDGLNLEKRALGRTDYPTEAPLREVLRLIRKCSGGLVLGFIQSAAPKVTLRPGTDEESTKDNVVYPTPWNQLEAGIMFSARLPILVFREEGVSGGIFDNGVSDVFIHKMPSIKEIHSKNPAFSDVILKWQAEVRTSHYKN
jgi:hypothetical protein